MNFETVIGLEIHIELNTDSKIFSTAPAHFGAAPNRNTNETDWAYPGVMPTLNKQAIDYGMRAALALNLDIQEEMQFDRKHYFYPDSPLAYQISQDEFPIARDGYLDIEVEGQERRIRIERLHLEADAGSLVHAGDGVSKVDLNRQGIPLVEIVTYPDLRSPQEAYAFLEKLRETVMYTGVSNVRMEEGSLRCDANISLRPFGQEVLGVKSELKNMNSFNFIRRGLLHEEVRMRNALQAGEVLEEETRGYDEATDSTFVMRGSVDYRFMPEPDLPPVTISQEWIDENLQQIPEMPDKRRERYTQEFGLPEYDAGVLTLTKEMSDFFEATVAQGADPNQASNWLMGDVSAHLNAQQKSLAEIKLTPEKLAGMINLIKDGTISSKIAKKLFEILATEGGNAEEVVKEQGMAQLSDPAQLQPIIDEVIAKNQQSVDDFKGGHQRAFGFLIGQTMQATRGQANPQVVNQLLRETLENL